MRITAALDKDDWQHLCRNAADAGADALELNLSLPVDLERSRLVVSAEIGNA